MARKELHVISTGRQTMAELAGIAKEIHPWVAAIHLREKTMTAGELMDGIELLLGAGVSAKQIIVNDRADVAAAAGARGVHLAYHSLPVRTVKRLFPALVIGKSVHSLAEARQAEADGADYVLFGHIYETASKPGLHARGIEPLKQICASVRMPVLAIGGIRPAHMPVLLEAGVAGAAVMSGVLEAGDPVEAAASYRHFMDLGEIL